MTKCLECGKEFKCVNMFHLKIHGYKNIKEYKDKYPDAKLEDCAKASHGKQIRGRREWRPSDGKYQEHNSADNTLSIGIDGKQINLTYTGPSETEWFIHLREAYGWTNRMCLRALLTLWEENKGSEIVNRVIERVDGGEKLSEVLTNPSKYHRDMLEELIRDLEAKAKKEQNPTRLATQIKSLAEIQKIRLELEKSYRTHSDSRIDKLIENTKIIFRNRLPELVDSDGQGYSTEEETKESEEDQTSKSYLDKIEEDKLII